MNEIAMARRLSDSKTHKIGGVQKKQNFEFCMEGKKCMLYIRM